MATKKLSKPKRSVKTERTLKDRIADAALKKASQDGWGAVSLADLADSLGEPFGQVIGAFPTTDRIAAHLFSRIDSVVLGQVKQIESDEVPRDLLFEILMMRFDALQEQRDGYTSILRSIQRRPTAMLLRVPGLLHSMALMLIASGISASGLAGLARVHALSAAYVMVLRTWLKDESLDMAQTMSALDKSLDRLQQVETVCVKTAKRAEKP